MEERWKPIPGFEGYEVSDHGRVRSYWRREKGRPVDDQWVIANTPQRIMSTKARISRTGYPALNIKGQMCPVHRLVLLAFVGPLPDGMETRHLDGNPENNHLSNLCYGTPSENSHDMFKHLGTSNWRRLDAAQVKDMRRMAQRGASGPELAEIFNVSRGTVSAICLGHSYSDYPGPIVKAMRFKPSKLTDKQVVEIRHKLKAGAIGADLAYQYGVSESMISRIKSGERRENAYAKKNQD